MTYPITQTFDPSIGEYGQDYALPAGTPIYSPVSGVISTEDKGKAAWGKRIHVFLSAADAAATGISSFAVGHLTRFAVSPGQHVNAGDLIGYSGGAASDPSSGDSTGPHIEPQFFNLKGSPINPVGVFARFTTWEQAIFAPNPSAAGASSSSSDGTDWGAVIRRALGLQPLASDNPISKLNPLAGVPEAITNAATNATQLAIRAFWIVLALVVFVIGLFLIFEGDLEQLGERAVETAEKVAPSAAVAA